MRKIIGIMSSKGGLGKSTISANLAHIIAKNGFKTLLIDGDILLPNLDVILKINPSKTTLDFLSNEAKFSELITKITGNFSAIFNQSGDKILEHLDAFDEYKKAIESIEDYEFVVIDMPNCLLNNHLYEICDEIVLICAPEPAAIVNCYSMIKALSKTHKSISVILNFVKNENEAKNIYKNLEKVISSNLASDLDLTFLGQIKRSNFISQCSKKRQLVTKAFSKTNADFNIKSITSNLLVKFNKAPLNLDGFKGLSGVLRSMSEKLKD